MTDFGIPVHPACDIFPLMDDDALDALAYNIKTNGLNHPIVLHDGLIVDGRNRLLACRKAGVEPRFTEWRDIYTGDRSVIAWIWSENFERRHLTPQQKAFAIVARKGLEEGQKARERQEAGKNADGTAGGRGRTGNLPPNPGGRFSKAKSSAARHYAAETRVVLAQEAGVSKDLIQRALNVQKAAKDSAPDLVKEVAQGKLTVRDAEARLGIAVPEPAPPPTQPAADDDVPKKTRQQIVCGAAKTRMVNVLSQIRGFCGNLSSLNVEHLAAASTPVELNQWAAIATDAAKELRLFSSKLTAIQEATK